MAFPYLDNPATLTPTTAQELDGLVAKLNSFLGQQHNDQGGHTDITAESVTIEDAGSLVLEDEDGFATTLARNVALGTRVDVQTNPKDTTPSVIFRLGMSNDPVTPIVTTIEMGSGLASGGTGSFPGIGIDYTGVGNIWRLLSGAVTSGNCLMFVDATTADRPLLIIKKTAASQYFIRPDTLTPVWLGDATNGRRFAVGYIDDVHSLNTYERNRVASVGDWTAVAYSAGDFTASAGTWGVDSGDVTIRRYALTGQTMFYNVIIQGSDVSTSAPASLRIALPTGYTVTSPFIQPGVGSDAGGANEATYVSGTAGAAFISVSRLSAANWSITAGDNTSVYVNVSFEVTG